MIRRVLLIQPFGVNPGFDLDQVIAGGVAQQAPLGLGYIAAYLGNSLPEITVEVYDANGAAVEHILATGKVDMDELWAMYRAKVADFKPDLVGVSCLFHSIAATANRSIDETKEAYPECLTVMGGNYPSSSPEDALSNKNLDYVIISEGDFSLTELVRTLNNSGNPVTEVDGIAYYDRDGKYQYRAKEKMIENLDEIPFPTRTHFKMDLYSRGKHFIRRKVGKENIRVGSLTASRGCPFKCTFCSSKDFWGQTMRYRNPAEVVREMQILKDDYGVNGFCFNDDNLLAQPKELLALLQAIIDAKLNISWVSAGGMQVSALTPHIIEKFYESGLDTYNLAIESGDRDTLRRIKKPLKDAETTERVIKWIREGGDNWVDGFFITGFPFETQENIRSTLDFCQTLDLDWKCIFKFQIFPGTEDYEYSLEKGYIKPFELWRDGEQDELLNFSTENFDSDWVQKENYLINLKTNFINNRNLQVNPWQAIRDFGYVIEMAPDHAVAYYYLGETYLNLGEYETAKKQFEKADELVKESKVLKENSFKTSGPLISAEVRWCDYFDHFKLDARQRLQELKSVQVS